MPYRYIIAPDASCDSLLDAVPAVTAAGLKGHDLTVRIAVGDDVPYDRKPGGDRAYRYRHGQPLWMFFARPMARIAGKWTVMDGIRMPRLEGEIGTWPERMDRLGYDRTPGKGFVPRHVE